MFDKLFNEEEIASGQLVHNKGSSLKDLFTKNFKFTFWFFIFLLCINFTFNSYETKEHDIDRFISYTFSTDYRNQFKQYQMNVIIDKNSYKPYKNLLSKKVTDRETEILSGKEKYLVSMNLVGKDYIEEVKRNISREHVIFRILITVLFLLILSFTTVSFVVKKLSEKELNEIQNEKRIRGADVIEDLEYEKDMRNVDKENLIFLSPICRLTKK